MSDKKSTKRSCGFVALVGAPNAGKSTLLNAMVGTKVSIVTHKVQTTRARVRGIAIEGRTQIIFVDTPGIFTPKKRLERAMVAAAWSAINDAEETVVLYDATRGGIGADTRKPVNCGMAGPQVVLAADIERSR